MTYTLFDEGWLGGIKSGHRWNDEAGGSTNSIIGLPIYAGFPAGGIYAIPKVADIFFNSADNTVYVWDGAAWAGLKGLWEWGVGNDMRPIQANVDVVPNGAGSKLGDADAGNKWDESWIGDDIGYVRKRGAAVGGGDGRVYWEGGGGTDVDFRFRPKGATNGAKQCWFMSNVYPEGDAIFDLGHLNSRWRYIHCSDEIRCDGTVWGDDIEGNPNMWANYFYITDGDGIFHNDVGVLREQGGDVQLRATDNNNIEIDAENDVWIDADTDIDMEAGDDWDVEVGDNIWIESTDDIYIECTGDDITLAPDDDVYPGDDCRNDLGDLTDNIVWDNLDCDNVNQNQCDVAEMQFTVKEKDDPIVLPCGTVVEMCEAPKMLKDIQKEAQKVTDYYAETRPAKHRAKPFHKHHGLTSAWKRASRRSTKCPSIISTSPGTTMGFTPTVYKYAQDGHFQPVALSGSVQHVKVEGDFEVGDILVSAGGGNAMVDNNAPPQQWIGWAKDSGKDRRIEVWVK